METNNNKSKYARLKGFLFFLIVATLFWLLTNFSKDKTGIINVGLQYREVPESTLLPQNLSNTTQINATANGFQMLFYRFKKPKLSIPLGSLQEDSSSIVTIKENQIIDLAQKQLKIKEVKAVLSGPIEVSLDKSTSKKIPVFINKNLNFKTGYRGLSAMESNVDSITIEGPSEVLSNIEAIYTKTITKNNISQSFSEEIALELPIEEINYNQSTVTVSLQVKEFTEKQLTLPIYTVNIPANSTLKTIPETLEVTFEVMVEQFGEISEDDFRIECDYLERIEDNNVMIPKIVKQPHTIFNVHLSSRKVDYLIFK